MKRIFFPLIMILNVIVFFGCTSKESPEFSSLPTEQQKAVKNSIEFIKNSSFTFKDSMDTDDIEIENATEETWQWLCTIDSPVGKDVVDTTDWIITVGSTSEYSLPSIVCDSSTSNVIGYIPTK